MGFFNRSIFATLAFLSIFSYQEGRAFCQFRGPHRLEIGPQWYYMCRTRKGGSKLEGNLYGGSFLYDRIRRNALYWGVEGYYAKGRISGTKDGMPLRSNKRDSQIEGRFGYSFVKNCGRRFWMTPFVGGGFFQGTNKFVSPSVVQYKERCQYPYFTVGFLFRCDLTRRLSTGLNFKTNVMIGARCKVFDDPEYGDNTIVIEDKPGFEVELPWTYRLCDGGRGLQFSLIPFYRFRRYGSHMEFPFDFIDTRYQIGGLKLTAAYLF